MFDEPEQQWQDSIDMIDAKYIDGEAYLNVHTIDLVNASLLLILDATSKVTAEVGEDLQSVNDTIAGALWVMNIWKDVHDEISLRAEVAELPDTIEGLTDLD